MSTPKYVINSLNAASGICRCYVNSQKANEWLCNKFGLVTDDNEQRLEGFIIDFCWKTQKWYVV